MADILEYISIRYKEIVYFRRLYITYAKQVETKMYFVVPNWQLGE